MTDLITADEATKLLDGATPGPWEADGDPWNRIIWSSAENRVCFMAHSNGLDDARDVATSNLVAAAPDLARTVIALHAQLAEARAAQAATVERCADEVAEIFRLNWIKKGIVKRRLLRALADPTGVRLLAELRAERDVLRADRDSAARMWQASEQEREAAVERSREASQMLAIETNHAAQAEAERDRLAAANAALEAKVAGLVEVGQRILDRGYVSEFIEEERGDYLALVAALATQEAGT